MKENKKLIRITLFYIIVWIFCISVAVFDPPFFNESKYLFAIELLAWFAPLMWVATVYFEVIASPKDKMKLLNPEDIQDGEGQG